MINQKALDLMGVTQFEFERWCKRNKKSAYKKSVQKEFIEGIINGKIIKDKDGKIFWKIFIKTIYI